MVVLLLATETQAQKVDFEEYDLDNGLHVILQQDNRAPLVTVAVMYHVGGKDEDPLKTGFAHFFEHLLFEGTENIARGEWDKLVTKNGGRANANTTKDRTYYYETFPSNNLELALVDGVRKNVASCDQSNRGRHPERSGAGREKNACGQCPIWQNLGRGTHSYIQRRESV